MEHKILAFAFLGSLAGSGCLVDESSPALDDRSAELGGPRSLPNDFALLDGSGWFSTVSQDGDVDLNGEFFQAFGTNGRTCGTCHAPTQGWTITPASARLLFHLTRGKHPLFRTNDGSNSPRADVSSPDAREDAYSMLLTRGVIRVGLPVPAGAEFELVGVDDPYDYASAAELSLFRRPLPATNLAFIPTVMWDGRVSGATIDAALGDQADGATLGHAQASGPLPGPARDAIVSFETALATAQVIDFRAGRLDAADAAGGTEALAETSPVSGRFDLFDPWLDLDAPTEGSRGDRRSRQRAAIARGQELFNTRPSALGRTCRGCHDVANVGSSLTARFFDVGVSAGARRTTDLPLYTMRNRATGELRQTTDPGRALVTGRWTDMDRFKVPGLRGLAARAPYFHDGSAETIADIISHYEEALQFDFTPAEEADLVAFLSAL